MNEHSNKKKSLKNDYFSVILVIFFSAIFVLLVFTILQSTTQYTEIVNWNHAFSIGGTLAIGYQVIFLISGGWERPINIFLERWKDFLADIKISFKFAVISLFDNLKNNGVVFLLYVFILLNTINMCVHGFSYLIELYNL